MAGKGLRDHFLSTGMILARVIILFLLVHIIQRRKASVATKFGKMGVVGYHSASLIIVVVGEFNVLRKTGGGAQEAAFPPASPVHVIEQHAEHCFPIFVQQANP